MLTGGFDRNHVRGQNAPRGLLIHGRRRKGAGAGGEAGNTRLADFAFERLPHRAPLGTLSVGPCALPALMAQRTQLPVQVLDGGEWAHSEESEPPISINLSVEVKKNLLLRAIIACRCERVKELLAVGADPNQTFTTKSLKHLSALPATLTAAFDDKEDEFATALTLSMTLLFEEFRLCIQTLSTDANMVRALEGPYTTPPTTELEADGWPRVSCAPALAPQWAVFVLLLRAGADPNAPSFFGKPPLMWAMSAPRCIYPVLRHLFHAGASLDCSGAWDEYSILQQIMRRRQWPVETELLHLVLSHGARFHPEDPPPLHRLAQSSGISGIERTLQLLLDVGEDVDGVWRGETPLMRALEHQDRMLMGRWLLMNGASVYAPAREKENALTYAKRLQRPTSVSTEIMAVAGVSAKRMLKPMKLS